MGHRRRESTPYPLRIVIESVKSKAIAQDMDLGSTASTRAIGRELSIPCPLQASRL